MMHKEKGLKAGQLTLLALGSVIGGSFFVGSSVAIKAAGPSILLGFILGGILVYFILYALSEMTVANPGYGSFRAFAAEAYGEGTGFVVGWVYWIGLVFAMSSEAMAVSILVEIWFPNISLALLGVVIIAAVTLLNLLGADKLSKLESGLAVIKVFAIIAFIITAALLILGLFPGKEPVGLGELRNEPLMPGGIAGLSGSMLIIIFTYAGFEIIGLAASEAENPKETVPKAIKYTVISLIGLYIIYTALLLPLIPTAALNENISPIVAALTGFGIGWASDAFNAVMISAILSTMMASMFGLGRIMRSIADERHAPGWLRDKTDVPYRGILFSGLAMLFSLGLSLLLPRVYLFLLSSGGFATLFSYTAIVATHIKLRKKNGCPDGKCQLRGYPYTSWTVLVLLVASILTMPFIEGQTSGLIAGIIITLFFILTYVLMKASRTNEMSKRRKARRNIPGTKTMLSAEFSEELSDVMKKDNKESK